MGACGYFARFQRELAEALPVPVFLSSLCQVPMVLGALQPQQQLGILCAKQSSLDQRMLTAVGIREDAPIVVAGMENSPGFRGAILEDQGWMDLDQVQDEVVSTAVRLVADHPEVGALLLECSDMPPYAKKIQDATGLPVWDYVTLIDWIHSVSSVAPTTASSSDPQVAVPTLSKVGASRQTGSTDARSLPWPMRTLRPRT